MWGSAIRGRFRPLAACDCQSRRMPSCPHPKRGNILMSRVHDALRRAGQSGVLAPSISDPRVTPGASPRSLEGLLERVHAIPYKPSPEALVIDALHPHEAATEEFRTLRTKLNHMQSLQSIHTAVVTSPAPGEGKSFAATNLALAEAQLSGNLTLLCDFDFRRPVVHN